MRRWRPAYRATACGNCPAVVPKGAPLLELIGAGWLKVRCEACAGEKVPDTFDPTTSDRLPATRFAERIEAMRAGRDWKHAQAGDR